MTHEICRKTHEERSNYPFFQSLCFVKAAKSRANDKLYGPLYGNYMLNSPLNKDAIEQEPSELVHNWPSVSIFDRRSISVCLSMSARHPRRGDACYRRDARKNAFSARRKYPFVSVCQRTLFEAEPQRSLALYLIIIYADQRTVP